jgi:hypothetical protein
MINNITVEERKLLTNPITYAGNITVGVTAVKVFDLNTERRLAAITNDSALDIYIGLNKSVTVNTGIRLNALGGSFEFGLFTTFPYLGEIWAIAAGAGNNLTFIEV